LRQRPYAGTPAVRESLFATPGSLPVKLRGCRSARDDRASLGAVPDCRTRRLSVADFYGIQAGTIPGFAEAGGGKFMSVQGLPDRTVRNMVKFMDRLRGMHAQDALAFEVCVRHVASIIEDQRREEAHADPRDDRAP